MNTDVKNTRGKNTKHKHGNKTINFVLNSLHITKPRWMNETEGKSLQNIESMISGKRQEDTKQS